MRSVEFRPEAQDEFISAAQFYERETEGLGLVSILNASTSSRSCTFIADQGTGGRGSELTQPNFRMQPSAARFARCGGLSVR